MRTLTALRRFTQPPPVAERCDLCSVSLSEAHDHLLEPKERRVVCACRACTLLFPEAPTAAYRRIVSRATCLPDVRLGEDDFRALGVPVRLVFLGPSRVHDCVFAVYPNAAGATEATLPARSWTALVDSHPALARIEPDVEGLFVHALGAEADTYHLSIDVCHRIVGYLRSQPAPGRAVRREVQRILHELTGGAHA